MICHPIPRGQFLCNPLNPVEMWENRLSSGDSPDIHYLAAAIPIIDSDHGTWFRQSKVNLFCSVFTLSIRYS